jgi:hypothetical protein
VIKWELQFQRCGPGATSLSSAGGKRVTCANCSRAHLSKRRGRADRAGEFRLAHRATVDVQFQTGSKKFVFLKVPYGVVIASLADELIEQLDPEPLDIYGDRMAVAGADHVFRTT